VEQNTAQSTTGFAVCRFQWLIQSIYTAITILLVAECKRIGGAVPNSWQLIWRLHCTADTAVIAREMHAGQRCIYTHHLGLVHSIDANFGLSLTRGFPCLVWTSTYCSDCV